MKKKDLDAIIDRASHAATEADSIEAKLLADLVVVSAEQLLQLSEIKHILINETTPSLELVAKGFSEFDRRVSGKMAITRYDIDEDEDDTPG